ncbi:MAG: four helix bundle protein [Sphingobacteriales bacterium]|nr:MAG: four helix bundle protein [Sphingobacteriales bacterium]
MGKYVRVDLDERLIDFSVAVIILSEKLPNSIAGKHICGQITRSGTAPALQYAEAQAAESPADFIHKMKVALKELRETYAALRIIKKIGWCAGEPLQNLLRENNELISIFVTSVKTARKNAGLDGKDE